jgi:transcription-repair coupling factor (superfamily II helicase)
VPRPFCLMKLTGLTSLLSQLEPLGTVTAARGHLRIHGLLRASTPAVLATIAEQRSEILFVVAAHPFAAQELADELGFWTHKSVMFYPAIETLPYERVRLDRGVIAAREAVLQSLHARNVDIVVASARAMLQPVERSGNRHSSTLSIGQSILPQDAIGQWIDAGYVDTEMVDEPGTFARRGGVLDVFPVSAERPVRIEWMGNNVESMRTFEPTTQRSIESLAFATVAPIASFDEDARLSALDELLDIDVSGLSAEARTFWDEDLSRLEAGAALDDLSLFGPYFLKSGVSPVAALSQDDTICILDASDTFQTLTELWEQARERQTHLEARRELPAGMRPALVPPETFMSECKSRQRLEFEAGSETCDGSGLDLTGLFLPAPIYAGRLRAFEHDVSQTQSQNRTTIVTTYQAERIAELLAEESIATRSVPELASEPVHGTFVLPVSLAEGWYLPQRGITVLTDRELFGRSRIRPVHRRKRAARDRFFSDFSPGDHVVHLEHGVGRFEGVTRMTVEDSEREYAVIQYAGTDRVYVPSDQLARITRYVGMGESAPHLNKLGGGEWNRARLRAGKAADDIAAELIDVYAKRMSRPGHTFAPDTPWQQELEASFPFPETPDQLSAVEDVKTDMEEPRPMDRLVCADVGYGKTEVAVRAAFKAVMDGRQVAVLVPTTILAQQHFETFTERLAAFPATVEVLSRFRTPTEQRKILQRVADGETDVLIGTHRLLQKDVRFNRLGLLIIDEEQRFGVKHKEQLRKMRESIDVLTLTATPIPRTLHMGLVGIREISVIETAPEGRLPIKTLLQPHDDQLIREAILRELDRDGQVYYVHNKVATIDALASRLRDLVPEARIVVGHGQMEDAQLERCMMLFAHHEADVLLCSTIIENGLDIPNVNTIIVDNAHRLGLTQLYQLRGRVGRSPNQAYAYLLYPRDTHLNHDAGRRMEAVFEAQELGAGFSIAMKDLEIRGAGNLLGAEQSGHAAAVGFDLYTRMIGDAMERLRGVVVEEPTAITINLPLNRFLSPEFVPTDAERLALYRRFASISSQSELDDLTGEIEDRFGLAPEPVKGLVRSVEIKLLAAAARVSMVSIGGDHLVMRTEPGGLYDRVALYQRYGSEARISTNVLRIPRGLLGKNEINAAQDILHDMIGLRESLTRVPVAVTG